MLALALLSLAIGPVGAFRLLLSSYGPAWEVAGAVQLLDSSAGALTVATQNQECGAWPTWLDLSLGNGLVTCIDEMNPGSLNMLKLRADGSIGRLSSVSTIGGPVSTVFYNSNRAVALAHYSTPAISTFQLTANNTFVPLQNFSITTPTGPNKDRQDTPHIHQAITDPSGDYLLFPNLGSDLVHVFCVDRRSSRITEHAPLKSNPGSGPRHAVFWTPTSYARGDTYLFVIHELSNRIVSYRVTYLPTGGLEFTPVDDVSTFGNRNASATANAAEIAVSPDNRFLVVSNRLSPISIPNPDASNSTAVQTDTLATFKLSDAGNMQFIQLSPSGGSAPRHFSINGDGTKVAVANFNSRDVAVFERDVQTGTMGKEIASGKALGVGSLTNVRWLEEYL